MSGYDPGQYKVGVDIPSGEYVLLASGGSGYFSVTSDANGNDTIDEIYSSISDKYSYDSLASNIDTLQNSVNEVKDIAESARYAAESTRDAVESHYNT